MLALCLILSGTYYAQNYASIIGGGKGRARGLKPPLGLLRGGLAPLRMISHRNYPSWSGAENRDKDRDTPIE